MVLINKIIKRRRQACVWCATATATATSRRPRRHRHDDRGDSVHKHTAVRVRVATRGVVVAARMVVHNVFWCAPHKHGDMCLSERERSPVRVCVRRRRVVIICHVARHARSGFETQPFTVGGDGRHSERKSREPYLDERKHCFGGVGYL